MKVGDLVKVYGEVGIVVAYYKEYDKKDSAYPWYVWINGTVKYYQTKSLVLV